MTGSDHYTIISSDTHAGGSHEQYREYLDPRYREEFDTWRGRYRNPWKDLRDTDLRVRNWDDDRRDADQLTDGVVGEVVFPNTVPPFYPAFVLFAPPPKADEYEKRRAGVHAHNRWMKDFCARQPERRAGIGQIFLNDIEDAIEDVKWIAGNGLRGGVLLPCIAPDVKWVEPLYSRAYDPLWEVIQDLDLVVNVHSGTGSPDYGHHAAAPLLLIAEMTHYSTRALVHLILGGVFERFPRLRVALTEGAASNFPVLLNQLDDIIRRVQKGGIGELKYREEDRLPHLASDYFGRNCWLGASFPGVKDAEAARLFGLDRFMWGSDYPHDEGTGPFTREHLRQVFEGWSEADLRQVLAGSAAELYGFDLEALRPLAEQYGPTVAEIAEPLTELPASPNEALLRVESYKRAS